MNEKEYMDLAIRTCKPLPTKEHLSHMILGIVGESFGELEEAYFKAVNSPSEANSVKLVDEAGDVCWYVAGLAHELKLDRLTFGEFVDTLSFQAHVGELSENIKKYVIYDKPLNMPRIEYNICGIITFIKQITGNLYPDVFPYNIHKLKQRFPDKFSEEEALAKGETK